MKKILILLVVLAAIGVGVGYYMYNKPVESLERKKADVITTADQLVMDYESNEGTANEKYLGKVVEVSGKVAEITNEEGKQKVILGTSNPISNVICELESKKAPGNLKAGESVKVKGMCSGYLSDVILVQSNIVK